MDPVRCRENGHCLHKAGRSNNAPSGCEIVRCCFCGTEKVISEAVPGKPHEHGQHRPWST